MADDLLELALAATGGQELWKTLGGLRIDISIGGPIWAMKGWSPDTTFDQILMVDTINKHIVFSPFTRADRRMVFDAATDSVTMETFDGQTVETLAPARAAFKGCCATAPGTPGTWVTSWVMRAGIISPPRFCSSIRMCGSAKSNCGMRPAGPGGACTCAFHPRSPRTIPARCSISTRSECNAAWTTSSKSTAAPWSATTPAATRAFDGLLVATRRRVFRRNPDNTVNLNLPSITLDIHDVKPIRRDDRQAPP